MTFTSSMTLVGGCYCKLLLRRTSYTCGTSTSNKYADWRNTAVLITEGTNEIGRESAIAFSALGARVAITGTNSENLNKVSAKCNNELLVIEENVANKQGAENIIHTIINKFGKLDVLINNTDVLEEGSIESTDLDQFDRIFLINVRSMYYITHLAVPHLQKTLGNIVNISNNTGFKGSRNLLAYSMSKAAVDQFTRSVAFDLLYKGVRCNSVNPGVLVTDILKRGNMSEEQYAAFLERSKKIHPLVRNGRTRDVVDAIIFLVSNEAGAINGANWFVDSTLLERILRTSTRYVSTKCNNELLVIEENVAEKQGAENVIHNIMKEIGKLDVLINNTDVLEEAVPQSFQKPTGLQHVNAAVDQFTRSVAFDLLYKGVRCNSVNPGVLVTDILKRGNMSEEQYAAFLDRSKKIHPLARNGRTRDVVETIIFLESNEAGAINGANWFLDSTLLVSAAN
nr:unnamed protein product [Callosobruchus analis]